MFIFILIRLLPLHTLSKEKPIATEQLRLHGMDVRDVITGAMTFLSSLMLFTFLKTCHLIRNTVWMWAGPQVWADQSWIFFF